MLLLAPSRHRLYVARMAGSGQTARLEYDGLACLRGDRLLFEGRSLRLGPGQAAFVSGANGAGKSTLLRLLAGLLRPTAGTIRREGAMALAAEAPALDSGQTLRRALGFWAGLDGADDRLDAAMDAMALAPIADVPIAMLSTGQRRRATIARVLASDAPIWLLDEPGNGLDIASLDRLTVAIAGHRAGGGIVVVASHIALGLDDAIAVRL